MKTPEINPGTNGKHEAPHDGSGAFHMPVLWEAPAHAVRPKTRRTIFPPDPLANSVAARLYNAYRHELAGARLTRWLIWLLVGASLVWTTGLLPGRWVGAGLWLAAALLMVLLVIGHRRRNFVHFYPSPTPSVNPHPLAPANKLACHVTGIFSVEGQYQRFTFLPGFYRTFATREHALLCLVRDRHFAKIGRWPQGETGMWYVFFTPELISQVRWGTLRFQKHVQRALAVDYQLTIVNPKQVKRTKVVTETVYLVPASADTAEEDARTMLADLLYDLQHDPARMPRPSTRQTEDRQS